MLVTFSTNHEDYTAGQTVELILPLAQRLINEGICRPYVA